MTNNSRYDCLHCREPIPSDAKTKRDLIGFTKVACPNCKLESTYPLSSAYSAFYLLLLLGNCCYLYYVLSRDGRFTLNPFGLVVFAFAAIGLVQNSRLKREIASIKRRPDGMPATDFRTYKRMMIAKDPAYASMSDRDLKPGYENWLAAQSAPAADAAAPKP